MSNTLPITIQMGALPPSLSSTPQQLADMIAARLSLVTSQSFALFVTGSTAPTSNVGPWLKNGNEWWVWSNGAGTYVPISIVQSSLGYTIGPNPPNPSLYQFWIETAVSGSPLSVKIYFSGAWVDVYATLLTTTLSAYATTTAMNAAIAAAVSGIPTANSYVGVATRNAAQLIQVDAAYHKMTLDATQINASGAIVLATSRYVAPVSGNYHMDVTSQFDNSTGTASSMQVNIALYKNGTGATEGIGSFNQVPSPVGSRWPVVFSGIIALAQNDYIECWASLTDGVNTGAVNLTTWDFSVHKV